MMGSVPIGFTFGAKKRHIVSPKQVVYQQDNPPFQITEYTVWLKGRTKPPAELSKADKAKIKQIAKQKGAVDRLRELYTLARQLMNINLEKRHIWEALRNRLEPKTHWGFFSPEKPINIVGTKSTS